MTHAQQKRLTLESDAARGRGIYPAFHALWPLAEIGVVSDLSSFRSDAWDSAAARLGEGRARTRVALIDTSVAADHPNLKEGVQSCCCYHHRHQNLLDSVTVVHHRRFRSHTFHSNSHR